MSDSSLVYVAYGPGDDGWAAALGEALERRGLPVFLQCWDIRPGNVRTHEIEDALRRCDNAVIVLDRTVPADEYPALLELADLGWTRLIPVLRDGAVIPPLLRGREPVSFAGTSTSADFEERVEALTRALRGEPEARRSFAAPLFDRVAEGPLRVRLRISDDRTLLIPPDGTVITAKHSGPGAELEQLAWDLGRARRTGNGAEAALARLGTGLGRAFLPAPVGTTLADLLTTAEKQGRSLRIGIEIDDRCPGLHGLAWESMRLPGATTALVLHPRVQSHRFLDLGQTVQPDIPGPLRVLAVIAGPDAGGRDLLDHEHELSMILARVRLARHGAAWVRILNWGSAGAIRAALEEERFHILHLSCSAVPGSLLLETADGAADPVDGARFVREVLPPDQPVPLVVLAGSSTPAAADLPGFARTLLANGVPSVLTLTAPVSDHYATELLSLVYGRLAGATEATDPIPVLADVRRSIEQERSAGRLPEWHAPALFTRVRDATLHDPRTRGLVGRRTSTIDFGQGATDLDSGDFVGRRSDLRNLLRALRDGGTHSGVLIHGLGGIGKSQLAAHLAGMMANSSDPVVVALHGRTTAEAILRKVAGQLRSRLPDEQEWKTLKRRLTDPEDDWPDRLALLRDEIHTRGWTVLLLLDDPLGDPLHDADPARTGEDPDPEEALDPDLRRFLQEWLRIRRGARLLVTARRADSLGITHRRLLTWHLGPLSRAETGKLIWRLPGVYALGPADQDRAYQILGGHPRALEYLDGFLRMGRPAERETGARTPDRRFDEVAERMEANLLARGISGPDSWTGTARRGVDTALAETVAGLSAEVLLDRILDRLATAFPEARELLLCAAVYRLPVDRLGLTWAVAEPAAPDPRRGERLRRWYGNLVALRAEDPDATLDDVSLPDREQLNRDLAARTRPAEVPWLAEARDELVRLGLLACVTGRDGQPRWMVHRWTAASLAVRDPDLTGRAHRRAAAYHRWWAALNEPDPDYDHQDLEEARHHCTAAGDVEQLVSVAAEWCTILHAAGSLRQEEIVCEATLRELADDHPEIWFFTHQLGVIAMRHGRYGEAADHHERGLGLAVAAGDPVAEATSRRELGSLAQLRNDPAAAQKQYRRAIQRCGDPAVRETSAALSVLASCYQLLCAMALAREDGEAWRWNDGAMRTAAELDERCGPVDGERQLAHLARAFGDAALADEHEFRANEATAYAMDTRRLVANSALQSGAVQLLQGAPHLALALLRRALDAAAEIGDRLLQAQCLRLLGDVLFQAGLVREATDVYRTLAELAEDLADPLLQAVAEQQLGRTLGARRPDDPSGLAEAHFAEADRLARELGNEALIAAGHLYRGEWGELAGHIRTAREQFATAVESAERCDDLAVWMSGALRLGGLHARTGNAAAAAGWFHRAVDRAHRAGNRRAEALAWIALGVLARERRDDEEADLALARAEAVASAGRHRRVAAIGRLHRATLAAERGRTVQAERHYRHVLAMIDERAHPGLSAHVHRLRGRDRALRQQWAVATADLTAALEIFDRYQASAQVTWCLLHLCHIAAHEGNVDAAEAAALRAGTVSASLTPSPLRVVALIAAGEEQLATGDPDGLARLDAALEAAEAVERDPGSLVLICRRALARAMRDTGDQEAAIRHLLVAHAIAARTGDRLGGMHDARDLGRAYLATGNPDTAAESLRSSARTAEQLRQPVCRDAARALLGGAVTSGTVAVADSRWRDLQWLRRIQAIDGEQSFTGTTQAYRGPTVDEVLLEMGIRHSSAAGVPFVVGPHRMTRRSHRS